jgi:hypothetical protein
MDTDSGEVMRINTNTNGIKYFKIDGLKKGLSG